MRKPLPEKLGGDLWFFLFMIVFGCCAIGLGIFKDWTVGIVGGMTVSAIFLTRLVQLVRDVRLARHLKDHPEVAKIYYAQN